ncbi:Carbohydrate binding domain-containing protein [Paenibacillus sp. OK060]|uniref:tail fiber protein n=1 Tax=Paenibacillus sp. OK060 TaxID=1881034 RepID=UPI00088F4D5C|nr:tail fiber protein [Paenibacillus sp. OK060]SDL24378.1 Carbohydrate binding domain-containing protein [Paenibacillus sp. OK060]
MNEPKTPNLGLNKIDRSSPSTTYFDLDKYLDQNWEKVDEGVATKEELEELRKAVGEINVPDASLTQKGKVQLSNEVGGTSETVAITEKALNDVRQGAISKNRPSNLLPNSSGELGFMGWWNFDPYAPFRIGNGAPEGPSSFVFNGSTSTTKSTLMVSDPLPTKLEAGKTYTLSVDMLNSAGVSSEINVNLHTQNIDNSGGSLVATIKCDATTEWHRKSLTFTAKSGVTYNVSISLGYGLPAATRQVRRLMFTAGKDGEAWNQDANDKFLLMNIQKSNIWRPIV